MNYKKIIRSRKNRLLILKYINWIPDRIMLRIQYRIKMGFWPDFTHPQRFSEKLQLYKMRYRNPIMPRCVDKYEVRKYVKAKGLEGVLNHLYGVYNNVNDIDFDALPNQFIMKSTTGGGGLNVVVVNDKNTCNWEEMKQKIAPWCWKRSQKRKISSGREWAYTGIVESRIIVEELLTDNSNPSNAIDDFKFFCFKGKPYCIQVDRGRYDDHRQNYYDMDWKSLGVHCTYPEGFMIDKPIHFDEMKQVASKLSEDFPFVRVDLYNINGIIIFGELTFYPSSGYGLFHPDSFDFELGKKFIIDF